MNEQRRRRRSGEIPRGPVRYRLGSQIDFFRPGLVLGTVDPPVKRNAGNHRKSSKGNCRRESKRKGGCDLGGGHYLRCLVGFLLGMFTGEVKQRPSSMHDFIVVVAGSFTEARQRASINRRLHVLAFRTASELIVPVTPRQLQYLYRPPSGYCRLPSAAFRLLHRERRASGICCCK